VHLTCLACFKQTTGYFHDTMHDITKSREGESLETPSESLLNNALSIAWQSPALFTRPLSVQLEAHLAYPHSYFTIFFFREPFRYQTGYHPLNNMKKYSFSTQKTRAENEARERIMTNNSLAL
jgi:hypothetical protein